MADLGFEDANRKRPGGSYELRMGIAASIDPASSEPTETDDRARSGGTHSDELIAEMNRETASIILLLHLQSEQTLEFFGNLVAAAFPRGSRVFHHQNNQLVLINQPSLES